MNIYIYKYFLGSTCRQDQFQVIDITWSLSYYAVLASGAYFLVSTKEETLTVIYMKTLTAKLLCFISICVILIRK